MPALAFAPNAAGCAAPLDGIVHTRHAVGLSERRGKVAIAAKDSERW